MEKGCQVLPFAIFNRSGVISCLEKQALYQGGSELDSSSPPKIE